MPHKGLSKANEIYKNRAVRAKELHGQGKKVMAYLCCYAPLEFMTAADIVPYRIMGNPSEPITEADIHMETLTCPFVRSAYDNALKGSLEFCDGLTIPHTCDSVRKTFDIWSYTLNFPYSHLLNVPHKSDESSAHFFKAELNVFRKSLEQFIGREISDESISEAVQLHNQNRTLIRELYELRKESPPLISGSEMTRVLVASMSIPVEECNELLRSVIEEVKERQDKPALKSIRLLVYGAEIDDTAFIDLVEESGGNVVIDDLCIGTKFYWPDVPLTPDPLDGIVTRSLHDLHCARTYKPKKGTYKDYQEERFGYIRDFAKDFHADAAILYVYRCCDPLGFDVPEIKDYLEGEGYPVLYLEDDYSAASPARLKTRVQAFLENIG